MQNCSYLLKIFVITIVTIIIIVIVIVIVVVRINYKKKNSMIHHSSKILLFINCIKNNNFY